jgi:hypothetical protein
LTSVAASGVGEASGSCSGSEDRNLNKLSLPMGMIINF